MTKNSSETNRLLRCAADGDRESLGALLARHENRLRRMVAFRLDPRLQGRIDASDVIQEVYVQVAQHLGEYLRPSPPTPLPEGEGRQRLPTPSPDGEGKTRVPFYLWLRGIAGNKLLELHRYHLGTPIRDARREVSLYRGSMPEATSAALAAQLLGHTTRPSEAAIRAEVKIRLQEALNSMDPLDREVLALRHFEYLSTAETAQVLGIKERAAGKRYLRALDRLREILGNMPGGMEL